MSGLTNRTYTGPTSLRTSYGSASQDPSVLAATGRSSAYLNYTSAGTKGTADPSRSASVTASGGYSSGLYPYPNSTILYDPTFPSQGPASTGGTGTRPRISALPTAVSASGSGLYTGTGKRNGTYPRPTATYRPRRPYSDYGFVTVDVTSRFTLSERLPQSTGTGAALNGTSTRVTASLGSTYLRPSLSVDPATAGTASRSLSYTAVTDTFPPYPTASTSTSTSGTDPASETTIPSVDATTAGTSKSSGFATSIGTYTGTGTGTGSVDPTSTVTGTGTATRPVRVPTPSLYYEPVSFPFSFLYSPQYLFNSTRDELDVKTRGKEVED